MSADRAASVLARLLNRSRSMDENFNQLLSRFVIERLLFRLSVSPHAGSFVLKGALLFALGYDTPHRLCSHVVPSVPPHQFARAIASAI